MQLVFMLNINEHSCWNNFKYHFCFKIDKITFLFWVELRNVVKMESRQINNDRLVLIKGALNR